MLEILKKNMICASLFIGNGVFLLLCPILHIVSVENVFLGTMIFYAICNAILFLLVYKKGDSTSVFTSLICFLTAIATSFWHVTNTPKLFAITLLLWTMGMSLVKLKKADIYHDKKSKLWSLQITLLVLFIISGLVTSINLLYEPAIQILVFGYFILIAGILEFIDPLIAYITKGKINN